MKKLSMLLAVLMVVTCCCVFASAEGEAPLAHYSFAPTNGSTDITYLGTETDEVPDDIFGIALNVKTDNMPFCRFKVILQFDQTKLEYVTCSENGPAAGDLLEQYTPVHQLNYDICNAGYAAEGKMIVTMTAPYNLTYKKGIKNKELYEGTMVYLYFRPLTAEACDTTITYTYTECMDQTTYEIPSDGAPLTLKLNGGAPVVSDPVVSLGAKINKEKIALRFGATYNRMEEKGAVDELGMLLLPQALLGVNELNLEYAAVKDNKVANLQAKGIVEFVSGQKFEDYATFTYYCTVVGLAGHEDKAIVARPYIKYAGGEVVYAEAMARSYNDIANPVA